MSFYLVSSFIFSNILGTCVLALFFFFFFQAEDGIRDWSVTGVQTCALPISLVQPVPRVERLDDRAVDRLEVSVDRHIAVEPCELSVVDHHPAERPRQREIGRASCRERV